MDAALAHWGSLPSDAEAQFDREVHLAELSRRRRFRRVDYLLRSIRRVRDGEPDVLHGQCGRALLRLALLVGDERAQHALGVDANLADLAQLQTVKSVIYSLSFPFPQCEQGAAPSDASTTVPASTVA